MADMRIGASDSAPHLTRRQIYEARQRRRALTVAGISTAAVVLALVILIPMAPGWEAVKRSFFDGEVFALDGICPHQGGPLGKGTLDGCIITCPWHGFQFNVTSGQNVSSPAILQGRYDVKLEEGEVYVDVDVDASP